MHAWAVVARERVHPLEERECTTFDGDRGLEHQPLVSGLAVRPVDLGDRAARAGEQPARHGAVQALPLPMQRGTAGQPVDAPDLVLGAQQLRHRAAEVGERETAASEQGGDEPPERLEPGAMDVGAVACEPPVRQADGVHAVLLRSEWVASATTIGSEGSMHVDPLSPCSYDHSHQKSWGAVRLVHCIYCSASSKRELNDEELNEILAVSRNNNAAAGITGMLLFHKGTFFQVLEGDKAAVENLFNVISRDRRHSKVTKIVFEPIEERAFGNWTMGYSRLSAKDLKKIEGLNDFFSSGRSYLDLGEGRAKKLLAAFKDGRWRLSLS